MGGTLAAARRRSRRHAREQNPLPLNHVSRIMSRGMVVPAAGRLHLAMRSCLWRDEKPGFCRERGGNQARKEAWLAAPCWCRVNACCRRSDRVTTQRQSACCRSSLFGLSRNQRHETCFRFSFACQTRQQCSLGSSNRYQPDPRLGIEGSPGHSAALVWLPPLG